MRTKTSNARQKRARMKGFESEKAAVEELFKEEISAARNAAAAALEEQQQAPDQNDNSLVMVPAD
ncbi:MAG TPA: hypothetical protein VN578_01695 [Candidatus Binatia bacterium]|jgi:hypothetical protein|nr:hypothetical protein [Candidatus Binatia bacterium]